MVHYHDTLTGERASETADGWWEDEGARWNDFIWTEGNFSCDCNRWLFLQRALGNEPDSEDAECNAGTPNRIRVRIEDEHGTLLYTDDD